MAHFPQTLCEEMHRTARSAEWQKRVEEFVAEKVIPADPEQSHYMASVNVEGLFQRGANSTIGWTYNHSHHRWNRIKVDVFMAPVRQTCQGRTINLTDNRADGDEKIKVYVHKAVARLLKQRARNLVCEALDAVELLGALTLDD